jgi:two-component system, sensor histidine kinase
MNEGYPIPVNEEQRLQSVLEYQILDTEEVPELNGLTRLAAGIFNVPMVLITILDETRQWFKSRYGLDLQETSRTISFCQYTILGSEVLQVPDAVKDARFCDNPLVTGGPNIRAYIGAPLINREGFRMGSLALLDRVPRNLSEAQKETLKLLATFVVNQFELHRSRIELEREKQQLEKAVKDRTAEIESKLNLLKESDRALNVANQDFSRFVYKASHDLRGPLRTMLGITDLALSEVREDNIRLFLNLLLTTENKLDALLANLLKVVEIKDSSPEHSCSNLSAMVNYALLRAKERTGRYDVDFRLRIDSAENLDTDRHMFEMMLEEIFTNSVIYNDHKRPGIYMSVADKNKKLQIDIEDNGIGISESEKDKIFNMFYKSQSAGSGLGLFLVKSVMEKLGGEIAFIPSENGSKFRIVIPK